MFQIKKALVTGASSGIGKAIADQLLREGCEVFALSRRVLDESEFQKGGTLHQIGCDITD
ncbi:MAG: SDR family oxidoreductase, partial [Clostridiales bacterium]|nr:SDR family oxidoreductase [Clostridiales bacterium]